MGEHFKIIMIHDTYQKITVEKEAKAKLSTFFGDSGNSPFHSYPVDLLPPLRFWLGTKSLEKKQQGSNKKDDFYIFFLIFSILFIFCRRRGITSASADTTRAESCAPPAAPCTTRNAGDPANISQVQHP
jgi:hypothetical protein